jgi:hypothetical protein
MVPRTIILELCLHSTPSQSAAYFDKHRANFTLALLYYKNFLATDLEARVRFPELPEKNLVGLERGALSLVSTTEELLDTKVAAPV